MTYTPPEQPAQQGGYQPYETASTQYGGYAAAPASTKKTLSMWGLILGISGIVIPIFVNSIAGAVLAGIGLAKEPAAKTMAIWGLVLSVLGFIWAFIFWPIVFTVIALAAFSESGQL
ncbi:hypothetical protein [Agrococcus beijingensis]|uniref:hypothetical protein n=1 Tax=Agrococcus beijingensis TaxID=3068634 RepID=UPI00274053C4|nr:hypothetical protein [Agrococcus sp. REN33]